LLLSKCIPEGAINTCAECRDQAFITGVNTNTGKHTQREYTDAHYSGVS